MVVELYDTERSYVEALQILVNVSTRETRRLSRRYYGESTNAWVCLILDVLLVSV